MQHVLCVCKSCSLSLYLGNEIFDVHVMQLQGDFNHLFVRQGTGLQGQSVFKTKLTFRFVPACFLNMVTVCASKAANQEIVFSPVRLGGCLHTN